eukprot:s975_g28.t1
MATASFLDSEATFVQQAEDAGLSQPWIDALKTNSVATFAKLSFAVTTPGTVATDEQVTRFLNTMRAGVAATNSDLAAFKRILLESQTLMMHSFKTTAKGDDSAPKRVAAPEREARLERRREQLRGLDIARPLEPAHSLYDLCASMTERNEIAYINPTKCLSRQQELMGSKPEKEIQLDASKTSLVVKEQANQAEISITSDLALYQALQRRTLAMDLTGLASYEIMRKWIDRLFALYSQAPAPGFQKITQAQLLCADRQAFVRMSELFTGSLKPTTAAGKPLDPLVDKLESDMTVTYFMLPVPISHGASASSGDKADKDKKRPEVPTPRAAGNPNKFQKGVSKGNQKGGKGKKRGPIPQALKGMHSRTPQGDAICFGYNLGSCKQGTAEVSTKAVKRPFEAVECDQINNDAVRPQFGAGGYFCIELFFCGTGNLTYAMKHFFPDSFGVDHKVNKQKVKVICLDLTKEDHQQLVEQWALSGKCLWVHFSIPCGTASRARFRRLSRKARGPPPIRNSKFPDGIPNVKGLHLIKLRAANRLYSFMRQLIKQLHAAGVVWTVENPFTSLLWQTSYWVDIAAATDPLCDGLHEHAEWPIDDLSQSQVNSTVTCYEQATVDGPDVICAFAIFLMRCLSTAGRGTDLRGRALDLASAYRQLVISDSSRKHAFLSAFSPSSGRAELFQQIALPFGSRTAVNAFIRCARFLQWTAARCLKIPTSCYFDDFVSFTYPDLAGNTQASLCLMLDILGRGFDKEGPTSDDFSMLVKALGVQFDLSSCGDGQLVVSNTEKRIREIVELLDGVLAAGSLERRDAFILRGRIAFCDVFLFGRLGKIALQNITRHAYAKPFVAKLSQATVDLIKLLRSRILEGKPWKLTSKVLQTFFLFTDASFDMQKRAGLGAVLVDSRGTIIAWFGLSVATDDLAVLLEDERENIIGELELGMVRIERCYR